MQFWWVNHRQTFKQEFPGGYLWAPTKRSDGAELYHWTNMLNVHAGDVVFSYSHGLLQGFGIAESSAFLEPRPVDFGKIGNNWADIGWKVPVSFRRFDGSKKYSPRDSKLFETLSKFYGAQEGALHADGKGRQVYLNLMAPEFGDELVKALGIDLAELQNLSAAMILGSEVVAQREENHIVAAINARTDITGRTKTRLVNARIGQGAFRERVLSVEKSCRLTGVENPDYLTASHIMPWRVSDEVQKVSGSNGLMLSPHIDRLFDKGFISFQTDGTLLVSDHTDYDVLQRWSLNTSRNVGEFDDRQAEFLKFHREKVFKFR